MNVLPVFILVLTSVPKKLSQDNVHTKDAECKAMLETESVLKHVTKTVSAQRGARTHDPEIKSLMLYRLS